jgi:hypothetical protein
MTDNAPDSGLNLGEQNANSDTSQGTGGKPVQGSTDVMPEWAKALQKEVAETRKQMQSDKDRAVSRISKDLESIKPLLERVKQVTGMDDAQAAQLQERLEMDEIKRRVLGGETQTSTDVSRGSGAPDAADISAQVIESLGFDLNDTEVAQIHARNTGNVKQLGSELKELLVSRATAPQPNAAANAAPIAGAHVPNPGPEQLTAQYQKDMLAARGNAALLKQIKEQARDKGVPVDSITFV